MVPCARGVSFIAGQQYRTHVAVGSGAYSAVDHKDTILLCCYTQGISVPKAFIDKRVPNFTNLAASLCGRMNGVEIASLIKHRLENLNSKVVTHVVAAAQLAKTAITMQKKNESYGGRHLDTMREVACGVDKIC